MERKEDALKVEVMAWVQSYKKEADRRPCVDGWVMFIHDRQGGNVSKFEVEQSGRHIDDFLDLSSDLDPAAHYPAFMVWEGTVRFSDEDFYTNGKWRRARASEIISAASGECPDWS